MDDNEALMEGIARIHEIIVRVMPAEIRGYYDEIMRRIERDLGESPEAWRGAVLMAMEAIRCITVGEDANLVNSTPSERLIMLVCSGLVISPYAKALEDR